MIVIPDLDQLELDDEAWGHLCTMASERQIGDEIMEIQAKAALLGRWDVVYVLSRLAGLETSVLIDAEDNVSVDWGSPGRVALAPPVGCAAPFKVWTHTHPGFEAYWSGTDTHSLAIASGIVAKALVLGAPGIKQSLNATLTSVDDEVGRISPDGPLNHWTDEAVTTWASFYAQLSEQAMIEVSA
ncbi:hypothetical protein N9N02_03475 [Candidatus Poseidoniales archaeon]|nr:hypothetical protein [Candidatus Poseidoniales archaeon]